MIRKTFKFLREERPGQAWRQRFQASWPDTRAWYLQEGEAARPSRSACAAAFEQLLPEMKPQWETLCHLAGEGDLADRLLSLYSPPNVFSGCSVAVVEDERGPLMVRNYDFDPGFTGSTIIKSRWSELGVIGLVEGNWGLLDGMNDAGLAIALTFGGRKVCGEGFSVILILRALLESCRTAAQAAEKLMGLRTYLPQNVVVLDASGAHFTAITAPDRDTRIWHTDVTTNHQEEVEWPEHAASSRTLERFDALRDCLAAQAGDLAALESRFAAPPVYSPGLGGMTTVYTALYRPAAGEVTFRWPGRDVRQSFSNFTETQVSVDYAEGEIARVLAEDVGVEKS